MKKSTIVFLFSFLITALAVVGQSRDLVYYVDMGKFYDQEGRPYMELYLDVDAASVDYAPLENGAFQSKVSVQLEIEAKEATEPVYDRTFELVSGEVADTSRMGTRFGIMDVRRIALEPGEYIVTGLLQDQVNAGAKQHKFVQEMIIEPQSPNFCSTSDIEFIQSFRKSTVTQPHSKLGYDIMPLVTNSTFIDADSLRFYLELYHVDRESEKAYFAHVYVTQANSTDKMAAVQKTVRHKPVPLDILSMTLNLSELPSQTYDLNVDIYNHQNKIIANRTKKFFLVNSKVEAQNVAATDGAYEEYFNLDEEQLDYYIHTLYYISTSTERNFAKALETYEEKKNYFLNFWSKRRSANAESPAKPWIAYKSRVEYANQQFKASHKEGWRTDRGRVMLTYGPPNDVERFPSSNTRYPYHIWRYNKIKTQANRIFIFFDPNMATGDYVLIHSDLNGEFNNPRWEFDVVRTAMDANLDVDDTGGRWDR
ncbi:MAG: GWxTD domain-containing protein [Bacteroidota bacterium]